MANVARERFIQTSRFRLQSANFHVDARGAQLLKAASAYFGIRIGHARDHTMNAGGDQRVSAPRRFVPGARAVRD